MKNISRRDFLGKSAILGSAVIAAGLPSGLGAHPVSRLVKLPLGFQTWTIREELGKDFAGTLKKMADMGYESVEMCSPSGYKGPFESLISMAPKEMLRIINNAGLKLESTHYNMNELRTKLDDRISFASESGQKQMIVASSGVPKNAPMSEWIKFAGELNSIGMKTKNAGVQMGYHNHHMEFEKINGELIYDTLLKHFDPEYVKMQFQVAVINIGYKASTYFNDYPDRFISAHLADWSYLENKSVPLGKGIVDWKEFFESAKKGGVKNIFVEMHPDTFSESATFIKTL